MVFILKDVIAAHSTTLQRVCVCICIVRVCLVCVEVKGGPEMNQTDLLYACLIISFFITAPKNRFLFVLEQQHCGSVLGLLHNGEPVACERGKRIREEKFNETISMEMNLIWPLISVVV